MRNRLNGRNVLSQSRARFTELRNLGVIYEKGIKQCSVTGRNAIEWELTNKLPKNKKPPITQKQERINKAITALRKLYRTRLNATDRDWQTVANLIKSI